MVAVTSNIGEHMGVLEGYAAGARVLIEIGCEYGTGSTWAFRRGFEKGGGDGGVKRAWISVDVVDAIMAEMRPKLDFWHFVKGDSREKATAEEVSCILENELGLASLADVIFIDTVHEAEFVRRELEVWSPLADRERCVWLFHDTWMHGRYNAMTDAIKAFAEQSGAWRYEDLSKSCHGLGALLPKGRHNGGTD